MQICLNCLNKYDAGLKVCPHCEFGNWKYKPHEFCLELGIKLKDRYKLGTVIGAGGFGITYRAVDLQTGNPVAVKEFYPNGMVSRGKDHKSVSLSVIGKEQVFAKGLNSFLEEAKGLAKFRGAENILQVYDFFEQNGTAYIVMEYLRGKSLSQYAADSGGRLSYDIAVNYMLSVLDALEIVHGAGMVHRDISPDNIFIQNNGQIKLIDFGAARESYGDEDKTLSIVLKPNYAPPEQFKKKSRQGPWTDIYALGATIYKVLTGKMPPESVGRYMEDDLIRPSTLNNTVPAYFDAIIYKAMALQIENRYQSAAQLRYDILNRLGTKQSGSYTGQNHSGYPTSTGGRPQNPQSGAVYQNSQSGAVFQNAQPGGVYRGNVQDTKPKGKFSGTGGIILIMSLVAVGIILIAVIIIALVKSKDDETGSQGTSKNTETVTTEAVTEKITTESDTTEATTETSVEDDYENYGLYIYDFPPIIYVDEAIFEEDADSVTDSAAVTYLKSEDGSLYTAVTNKELYTTIEIDADEQGKIEAVAVAGQKYTDSDIEESLEELELWLGEGTKYDSMYLWEKEKMCTVFLYDDTGIYILYMTPEYWALYNQ